MKGWAEELLMAFDGLTCEKSVFRRIEATARSLGFDYCAYGLRAPWPVSRPKISILSNYPSAWCDRYRDAGYLRRDPTVAHGAKSQTPVVWSQALFSPVTDLWSEARAFGLRVGCAQSSLMANGSGGMLTLARAHDEITPAEMAANQVRMRWLVNVAQMTLAPLLAVPKDCHTQAHLTQRELEVLKWTADGKSSGQISDILTISIDTVNFHVKNAVRKLSASNKTAAVVRAAMTGLLA